VGLFYKGPERHTGQSKQEGTRENVYLCQLNFYRIVIQTHFCDCAELQILHACCQGQSRHACQF